MNERSKGKRKRIVKQCPFKAAGWKDVDYKDIETLRRFTTDKGKILPRRVSGVSAYFQRRLSIAIRRARYIGLMPFDAED